MLLTHQLDSKAKMQTVLNKNEIFNSVEGLNNDLNGLLAEEIATRFVK